MRGLRRSRDQFEVLGNGDVRNEIIGWALKEVGDVTAPDAFQLGLRKVREVNTGDFDGPGSRSVDPCEHS